jgi:hypothetical protein
MWQGCGNFVGAFIYGLVSRHNYAKVGQLVILIQEVKVGKK